MSWMRLISGIVKAWNYFTMWLERRRNINEGRRLQNEDTKVAREDAVIRADNIARKIKDMSDDEIDDILKS